MRAPGEIIERMKAAQYAARFVDEDALQASVCEYLDVYVRTGQLIYWSTPNELPRPKLLYKLVGKAMVDQIYTIIGAALNRRGRKSGAPDITIQIARGPALYLECKTANGRLSEKQKAFRDWFIKAGCHWAEVRTLDDVRRALEPLLKARLVA